MTPFSPTVSVLYSELLQELSGSEASEHSLRGTFVSKKNNSNTYWYQQVTQFGKQHQIYLGAETPELLQLIKNHKDQKFSAQKSQNKRTELCAMLQKGGIFYPDPIQGRILEVLTTSGVFRLGAVLVGSHAFLLYGNLLGYRWEDGIHTQDIDLVHDNSVSLAVDPGKINLPDVLEKTQMGFDPVLMLNHKHPSTSFKLRNEEIRVDILTPLTGKDKEKPFFIRALNTAAQPLRFLDYLIQDSEKAAVVYKSGLLVNVPNPARFAFHKLIVSQRRPVTSALKIKKDVRQAGLLFSVLLDLQISELKKAWKDLEKRGKGWIKYVKGGLQALLKNDPVTGAHIQKLTKLG